MHWKILTNDSTPDTVIGDWLFESNIPPWRRPPESIRALNRKEAPSLRPKDQDKGKVYVMPPCEGDVEKSYNRINAALMLRRPILVKGVAGIGKSSLAYYLSYVLGLGAPLIWPINSKSTLKDGLYHYDAVGHLSAARSSDNTDISSFIRLNALGTALLPWKKPRVLLIDEIDKSSYDLPNDLLYILEDGRFSIPELMREKTDSPFSIQTADVPLSEMNPDPCVHSVPQSGVVEMYHPPVMVMTSNNERDFSDAFKRRCIVLDFQPHKADSLWDIVCQHLKGEFPSTKQKPAKQGTPVEDLRSFFDQLVQEDWPTDKVLQAMFLIAHDSGTVDVETIRNILRR